MAKNHCNCYEKGFGVEQNVEVAEFYYIIIWESSFPWDTERAISRLHTVGVDEELIVETLA